MAEEGFKELMEGTGLRISRVKAFEREPSGLITETLAVPAVEMSDAVIVAVNWLSDANVVCRPKPFHLTVEPLTKLLPFTVSVKEGPPVVAYDGLTLVTVGWGARISKVTAFERFPPGLNTVTGTIPDVASCRQR